MNWLVRGDFFRLRPSRFFGAFVVGLACLAVKVIIQTKGQSPIKADHIRYFEDPYFIQLMKTQNGFSLPYPVNLEVPDRPEFEDVVMKAGASEISDDTSVSKVDIDALAQVQSLWDDLDNDVSGIQQSA